MNEKEIKKKIESAKKIVEKLDEPYKTESFKIILTSLIKKIKPSENNDETSQGEDENSIKSNKLEDKIKMSKSELMNVINFEGEKCELINVVGTSNPEKLLNGSLIILTALRIKNADEWVTAVKLCKILADYGLIVSEISRILQRKENGSYFRTKGINKGRQYRITSEGIKKGTELIKGSA